MSEPLRDEPPSLGDFADASFRTLADTLPHMVFQTDATGRFEYVSKRYTAFTGMDVDVANVEYPNLIRADERAEVVGAWSHALASGEIFDVHCHLRRHADGDYRWCHARGIPLVDSAGAVMRWIGTVTEVHEQYLDIERQRSLAEIGRGVAESFDLRRRIDASLGALLPEFADWTTIALFDAAGSLVTMGARHRDTHRTVMLAQLIGESLLATAGSPLRDAIDEGHTVLLPEIADDTLTRGMRPDIALLVESLGVASAVILPLATGGSVLGTFTAVFGAGTRRYHEHDRPFLEDVARRIAAALENAQLYARAHRVADRLQRASLPASLPSGDGLRLDAVYAAANADAQIGGDWYDAFRLPDRRLVLTVGDVSGSGLEAAVTMNAMRQSLRSVAHLNPDPLTMLDAADKTLRLDFGETLVTAFVGVYDPVTGLLTYASAGHPAPLVREPDGTVRELWNPDLPLGFRVLRAQATATTPLVPGSILVLYTDGLTEIDRDLLGGERRLIAALSEGTDLATSDVAAYLRDRLLPHGAADDVAILAMHVDARDASSPTRIDARFDVNDVAAARAARDRLHAAMQAAGATSTMRGLAELALSELLANVLRHAPGIADMRCEITADAVVINVLDDGPGFSFLPRLPHDHFSESGRGLYILAQLVETFSVDVRPGGGSHARAVIPLRGETVT